MESVLRDVCDKVLSDPTVSKEVRKARAEGLKIIGNVYRKVQSDVSPQDARTKKQERTSSSFFTKS